MTNVPDTWINRYDSSRARTDNNGEVTLIMERSMMEAEEDLLAHRRFAAWKRRQR